MLKKLLNLSNTEVLFLYKNGYYERGTLPKEDDKTLTVMNRTIIKNTNDAFINEKGHKLFFVNGMDCKTTVPDEMKKKLKTMKPFKSTKEESEMDREATYAVMKTNLLKGLAQMQSLGSVMSILLLIAGGGIGYVLGSEWGGDTYHQEEFTENYNTGKIDNETIVITMIRIDILWTNSEHLIKNLEVMNH